MGINMQNEGQQNLKLKMEPDNRIFFIYYLSFRLKKPMLSFIVKKQHRNLMKGGRHDETSDDRKDDLQI